ncbi:MAG: hypothetical protein ACRELY_22485 [Polyangiaceae bacterium]
MRVVLDAGALVAVDRADRRVGAMLRVLEQRRIPLSTSAAVVAQVWRNGSRQALLAKVLQGVAVRALGVGDDRSIGELLAATRTSDVVDGHVALLAGDGDVVMTSDPSDLRKLLDARRVDALVMKA